MWKLVVALQTRNEKIWKWNRSNYIFLTTSKRKKIFTELIECCCLTRTVKLYKKIKELISKWKDIRKVHGLKDLILFRQQPATGEITELFLFSRKSVIFLKSYEMYVFWKSNSLEKRAKLENSDFPFENLIQTTHFTIFSWINSKMLFKWLLTWVTGPFSGEK